MNGAELNITKIQADKLLAAASGDAALLYIYLRSGNDIAAGAFFVFKISHSFQLSYVSICSVFPEIHL